MDREKILPSTPDCGDADVERSLGCGYVRRRRSQLLFPSKCGLDSRTGSCLPVYVSQFSKGMGGCACYSKCTVRRFFSKTYKKLVTTGQPMEMLEPGNLRLAVAPAREPDWTAVARLSPCVGFRRIRSVCYTLNTNRAGRHRPPCSAFAVTPIGVLGVYRR